MNHNAQTAQRWVTFDCYGTLVDWKTGMADAIESAIPGQSRRALAAYHQIEPHVQSEKFRSYREVLAEALVRAARQESLTLDSSAHYVLAETLPDWPVFPDTVETLHAIRDNGWRIGILSNVDKDLIAGTLERLPVTIDAVVTVEDVHAYKPDLAHFERFQAKHLENSDTWVHVGCDVFHDMVPASTVGIPHVLVDRNGAEDGRHKLEVVLPDLTGLPGALNRLG